MLVWKLFHSRPSHCILQRLVRIVLARLFCGCQRNAVPEAEDTGFGFMPNPGVYSANLCGLDLAELGTHE